MLRAPLLIACEHALIHLVIVNPRILILGLKSIGVDVQKLCHVELKIFLLVKRLHH